MMNLILEDREEARNNLLPLTFVRPTAMLPAGMRSIRDLWAALLPEATVSFDTAEYLKAKYPTIQTPDSIHVAGHVIPTETLATELRSLAPGQWIADERGDVLARRGEPDGVPKLTLAAESYRRVSDIFGMSRQLISRDYERITAGRESAPLPEGCRLRGDRSMLFIEPGATVECACISVEDGPVYIGRDAIVEDTAVVRGPVNIGARCRVRAGTRLYGGVNLGPDCRVGGEVSNAVFLGYSNKQHDGYLGDAVIGEWCNLGAGCTASNLKNSYARIRLWNYVSRSFERTDLQLCGLIMGDYSKAGIGTMFNTATVVGVGCNIHGVGFPRAYIPSFSDGGAQGFRRATVKEVTDTAEVMYAHREQQLSVQDITILTYLHEHD